MRKARDAKILINKDTGRFFGFDLGAEYCGEHEFGIKKLRLDFGITAKEGSPGIENNICQKTDDQFLYFVKDKKYTLLIGGTEARHIKLYKISPQESLDKLVISRGHLFGNRCLSPNSYPITTAWDTESFGILARNNHDDCPEISEHIADIYNEIKNKNVIIYVGTSTNPFERAGLLLLIANRLPENVKNAICELSEVSVNDDYKNKILEISTKLIVPEKFKKETEQ